MSTLTATAPADRPTPTLLRRALLADAATCAACGLLFVLDTPMLAAWFGLPTALLRTAGLALLPFAAFVLWLGTRVSPPRAGVLAAVGLNALWVVESLVLLVGGWVEPTALGIAIVLAQAALVAVLAELEFVGLRRLS